MHQAFSDDSMSGEGGKTLLLAACVQKYPVWADFCFAWEAALAAPPSIQYFKMREARALIKQFHGWKPIERDKKIELLTRAIMEYRPKIICAWISRTEFTRIVAPIIPYMLRHPYTLIFYPLIIKLAEWQHSAGITLPTDFVFDEQQSVGPETVIWYAQMKAWQPPHIAALMGSTPIFRDDKFILPLQAADIVAWHKRRRIDNPTEDASQFPTSAIEDLPYGEVHIGTEYLTKIAKEMAQVPGITLAHDKPKGYIPGSLPEGLPMPDSKEFANFDRTMQELVKVSHDEVKAKLDAEKRNKSKKRKAKRASASRDSGASRHGSGGT